VKMKPYHSESRTIFYVYDDADEVCDFLEIGQRRTFGGGRKYVVKLIDHAAQKVGVSRVFDARVDTRILWVKIGVLVARSSYDTDAPKQELIEHIQTLNGLIDGQDDSLGEMLAPIVAMLEKMVSG